jgi:hypothetical protein
MCTTFSIEEIENSTALQINEKYVVFCLSYIFVIPSIKYVMLSSDMGKLVYFLVYFPVNIRIHGISYCPTFNTVRLKNRNNYSLLVDISFCVEFIFTKAFLVRTVDGSEYG